jgi:hypothetical protein
LQRTALTRRRCTGVFYVNGQLIVSADAAATAANITAHERLFRLGIASNLVALATDGILLVALYVVLKPISRDFLFELTLGFWLLVDGLPNAVTAKPEQASAQRYPGAA